jgi:hypothetical protein
VNACKEIPCNSNPYSSCLVTGKRYLAALKCGFPKKDEGAEFRRSHDIDYAVFVQLSS